ncbi:SKP1-like protein 1A [Carex littledalei]|uniref:SKP1-like protein n=1 Tax=Carex littledalei TaxID=544730 RepID=A0A833QMR4_9POAL|nr:SKP1-like protein 1A [Carex littledalei]
MFTVQTKDDEMLTVPQTVVDQCKTIIDFKEHLICDNYLPLPEITSATLKLVIAYCEKHHVDASKIETTNEGSSTTPASPKISDEELSNWDNNFLDMKKSELHYLIRAAQYLRIEGLLEVSVQKMATILNRSPDDIRVTFQIKSDFTEDDKEELRGKYQRWLSGFRVRWF